jgi:signal transduction histidine kinase
VACGLTGAASLYVSASARSHQKVEFSADRVKFEADAQSTRQQLAFRLDTYVEVTRAGAALIGASNEINGIEFRAFVRGLRLRERYPGMIGIGYAPRVSDDTLRTFVRSVSQDSPRPFHMWPTGARREHFPALFLEPVDAATSGAIGFDLSTDAVVLDLMERARDTGQATASDALNTGPLSQPGRNSFVLLIPVYRLGMPVDTVDARRRWLTGFVFSPINAEDVLAQFVANTAGLVSLEVYDGTGEVSNLLGRSHLVRERARFESTGSVQIGGRQWLVRVKSLDGPLTAEWQTATGTLLVGLLLSICLFLITSAQVRAWETSVRHEAELRASAGALRESEANAHAADRAKDEFLATLSHELRTPLNAILGWVTMLRRGSIPPERRGHGLAVIERNARLQAHLIEDLLDVSRIIMGKVRLQMGPLLVAPVISAVVESLRPGAEAKGVQLHASLVAEAMIQGDAERIQQIIWNLVANGIKFTPAGGHVYVELLGDDRQARIAVRDTGIGITADFPPTRVRALPPGRRVDDAAAHRHRARAVDRAASGRTARRVDRGKQQRTRSRRGIRHPLSGADIRACAGRHGLRVGNSDVGGRPFSALTRPIPSPPMRRPGQVTAYQAARDWLRVGLTD